MVVGAVSQAPYFQRAQIDSGISSASGVGGGAGTASPEDQAASSNAQSNIGERLSSQTGNVAGRSGQDARETVNSLIAQQVQNGELTGQQAAELQSFFAQGSSGAGGGDANAPEGGSESRGGPENASGPSASTSSGATENDSGASSASAASESTTDQLEQVIGFLESLKEEFTSGTVYNSNAVTKAGNTANTAGLILNLTA